jgi:Asp-tRNA(Asn)/Glu-tRNA(Gln) amidotransferase B subunit
MTMDKLTKLNQDLLAAFKAGDSIKKNLLRTLKGEAESASKKGETLDDRLVERTAKKFIKSIESLEVIDEVGQRELDILREYLPDTLSRGDLRTMVQSVLKENPDKVSQYASGNKGVVGFFVGSVMKTSEGKADAKIAKEIIENELTNG